MTQQHNPIVSACEDGFTLVELIIAIVIISVSLTGVLLAINLGSKYSADPTVNRQASAIAQAYMDEILTKSFPTSFPCPAPPGGGRSVYTSVCDYQGLSDTGAKDQFGNALTGLDKYNVSVNIDGTTAALGTLTPGTQVVRVDVTVSRNLMPTLTISGYRTKY
ncbi:MAG: biosis protein MshD [Pseudomonadota bacterium]|jgi:MSHA pilin protein MshD